MLIHTSNLYLGLNNKKSLFKINDFITVDNTPIVLLAITTLKHTGGSISMRENREHQEFDFSQATLVRPAILKKL